MLAEDPERACGLHFEFVVPKGVLPAFELSAITVRRWVRLSGYAWEQIELPCMQVGSDRSTSVIWRQSQLRTTSHAFVHDAPYLVGSGKLLTGVPRGVQSASTTFDPQKPSLDNCIKFSADQLMKLGVADRPAELVTHLGVDHVDRWSPDQAKSTWKGCLHGMCLRSETLA